MGNDRTLSKARKIAQRLAGQIEKLSDALEDLELEFAMLMKTIDKMESKQGTSREVQIDVSAKVDEEDDNDFDVTNTSAPTVKGRRKFLLFRCCERTGFTSFNEGANAKECVRRTRHEQHQHRGACIIQAIGHDHEESGSTQCTKQTERDSNVHPQFALLWVASCKNAGEENRCTEHRREIRSDRV